MKNMTLAADAAIDLQLHTTYSDGTWTPEALIDYLVSEQFGLAAITDHERVDTVARLQQLAAEKQFPLLAAVEMTARWHDSPVDLLCFGFDSADNKLNDVAQDAARRQTENTRMVYRNLWRQGYFSARQPGNGKEDTGEEAQYFLELRRLLEVPSAQQPHELVALITQRIAEDADLDHILNAVGFDWEITDIDEVVDAAHRSGAVCLIAHPGRGGSYPDFDVRTLNAIFLEARLDGLEVYYPTHTPKQTAMYLEYAQQHNLLISSGSDSHGPEKKPIKYPASQSRKLLERLGIQIV
jgi:predicted metal-dependent phosphoesterase TrpH